MGGHQVPVGVRVPLLLVLEGPGLGGVRPVAAGGPVTVPLGQAVPVTAQVPRQVAGGGAGPEVHGGAGELSDHQSGHGHQVPLQPLGGVGGEQLDGVGPRHGPGSGQAQTLLMLLGGLEPGQEGGQVCAVPGGGLLGGAEVIGGVQERIQVAACSGTGGSGARGDLHVHADGALDQPDQGHQVQARLGGEHPQLAAQVRQA